MTSLVELVRRRARETPDLALYTFLADDGSPAEDLDAAALERRSTDLARTLAARAARGERALLLFPPGLEFVVAFFACLAAGVVAVPAYPPGRRRGRERLGAIARDAEPSLVVTTEAFAGRAAGWVEEIPGLGGCRVVTSDGTDDGSGPPEAAELPLPLLPDGDDLAFLQYTSGSTSIPKGVRVLHRNLIDNEEAIRRAFGQSERSVVVSWLPLYHDMGLIGGVLQPLYVGGRCVLMAPAAFLKRPALWLETIHRHRATTSGGPDFAYALTAERVAPDHQVDGEPLDLSSWRVAFDGSEPVRAATLGRFAGTFAPAGFDVRAFYPCYGLAEATLFVTGGDPESEPRVLDADAASLESGTFRPASPDARATSLVSCGRPWGGHRVQVVDPESRRPVPPGTVGEIWVHGASVADGYHRAPEATAEAFAARLSEAGDGLLEDLPTAPWLRTGDLGLLTPDGELVVTGRLKDLVVLRGRNLYPHDVELAVERTLPVRPGAVAAFAVPAGDGAVDGEALVVVAELDRSADASPIDRLAERARQAVAEAQEAALSELVLIRPLTLPKTSSGKVRRRETRRRYLADELAVVARSGTAPDAGATPEVAAGDVEVGDPADLRSLVARLVGVAPEALPADRPLVALGLDSLGAVELAAALEARGLGRFDGARLLDGVTLAELESGPQELGEGSPAELPELPEIADPDRATAGEAAFALRQRLAPESSPDGLAVAFHLERSLDREALETALARLARRHPAVATTFVESDDGTVRRRVVEGLAPTVTWHDQGLDGDDERAALDRAVARPFDLARGPLLRLEVWPRGDGKDGQLVLAVGHHAVLDHRSAEVLLAELGTLLAGGELADDDASAQADETAHARRLAAEDRALAALADDELDAAWRRRLRGRLDAVPAELDLPTDRPRPVSRRFAGDRVGAPWPAELGEALVAWAGRSGVTPFAVLLAAWSALLGRLTGQDELLVGVPASVRGAGRAGDHRAVGYLVDVVPVRGDLADASFAGLVERTRHNLADSLSGAALPFPALAARLAPGQERRRPPLVQTLAVLHRPAEPGGDAVGALALGVPGVGFDFGGVPATSVAVTPAGAPVDLTLSVAAPAPGGHGEAAWWAALQFDRDLFDRSTALALLERLERLLTAGLADPDLPVERLPLVSPTERRTLVAETAHTPPLPSDGTTLPERVFARAAEQPDAPALHDRRGTATYGELAARAATIARRLVARGVGPGDRVVVSLSRNRDLVAALLGVMTARGASAPVDPAYPPARRRAMERSAGAVMVLDEAGLAELLADPVDGPAEVEPLPSPEPGDLAYLIFTSGSTGEPKAVAIEHGSAAALMDWAHERFGDDLAVVLASTSASFDLSVFELFAPLARGGEVVLLRDALELAEGGAPRAARRGTLWSGVPSAAAELVRAGALPPTLGTAALAGEALPAELVERLAAAGVARVSNLYGPSEDTTYSTEWHWRAGDDLPQRPRRPPIGRPLPGGRALVLDRNLEPVPAGVVGELVLGGVGLARGYLGNPRATAEAFVPDPFADERVERADPQPGARLYRTGDLARWSGDVATGQLDFLGRRDRQVKVRGFRVEPGEIESVLATHPDVTEAAVAAVGDLGERRLVAWVAPDDVDVADLLEHAAGRLARPLVPSAVVTLAALPRTPNGKLDRSALPAPPEDAGGDTTGPGEPPEGPTEEALADVWRELLELPADARLSRRDDFFRRGGHSLLAGRLVARVRRQLGVELDLPTVFDRSTLTGLAAAVEEARRVGSVADDSDDLPPLVSAPPDAGPAPLAPAQARLWFLDRLAPEAALYVLPGLLELAGPVEPARLACALGALVHRQESLRTRFVQLPGAAEPVQEVDPAPTVFPLPVVDLSGLADRAATGARHDLAVALARRPFDLTEGPGLRAALLRRGPERHALSLTVHHSVADGWSLGVMLRELAALHRGETLPPLPVTAGDVARWQRRFLDGPLDRRAEAQLDWWRRHLDGLPASLPLPTDRPRPAVRRGRGLLVPVPWPGETARGVTDLARRLDATPFAVVLAAFEAFLARLSGEDDFAVAVPVAGRRHLPAGETDSLVGCFVNTLVVRSAVGASATPSFSDLVAGVRAALVGALEHQDVPFDRVVDAVGAPRDRSRTPLAQVMLADQEVAGVATAPDWPGLDARLVPVHPGSAKVDLTLAPGGAGPEGRSRDGWLEVDRDLFDEATARRLVRRFVTLLGSALEAPERPVAALGLLDEEEQRQVAAFGEGPPLERPAGWSASTLHGLVLEQAQRCPDAVAVEDDGTGDSITYGALERRSARLAVALERRGVEPGDRVAVSVERSSGMVVALLGVLRAGAAYVPLDPDDPAGRRETVVEDSGARVVLTAEDLHIEGDADVDTDGATGDLDDSGVVPRDPDAPELPAYVIYTSGSTGRPKGVVNAHRGPVRRLLWGQGLFPLDSSDRVLQKTPITFDVSVYELFQPLAAGARLVLARPGGHRDGRYLAALLARREVTLAHFVPSMLRLFLDTPELPALPALRTLLASGEALTDDDARRVAERFGGFGEEGTELWNLYGPTEAAIEVSAGGAVTDGSPADRVTLGRPAPGCRLRVVDRQLEPAGIGTVGELVLGGPQVAVGYLGRPARTAVAFVPDPFAVDTPGARLYRTGDRVRLLEDGRFDYLGRLDAQLKVRGVRVEAGEVEAALVAHPGVGEAAVAVVDDVLVAFLVADPTAAGGAGESVPPVEVLRTFLGEALPAGLVPGRFVPLPALPRLPSGKVDRRRLPRPSRPSRGTAATPDDDRRTPFDTPTERQVGALWQEALGLDEIGADDDFFRLGGHSLLASRILFSVEERFGVEIPLAELFDRPTVAGLAAAVDRHRLSADEAGSPLAMDEGSGGGPGDDLGDLDALLAMVGELSDDDVERLLSRDDPNTLEGDPVDDTEGPP